MLFIVCYGMRVIDMCCRCVLLVVVVCCVRHVARWLLRVVACWCMLRGVALCGLSLCVVCWCSVGFAMCCLLFVVVVRCASLGVRCLLCVMCCLMCVLFADG